MACFFTMDWFEERRIMMDQCPACDNTLKVLFQDCRGIEVNECAKCGLVQTKIRSRVTYDEKVFLSPKNWCKDT